MYIDFRQEKEAEFKKFALTNENLYALRYKNFFVIPYESIPNSLKKSIIFFPNFKIRKEQLKKFLKETYQIALKVNQKYLPNIPSISISTQDPQYDPIREKFFKYAILKDYDIPTIKKTEEQIKTTIEFILLTITDMFPELKDVKNYIKVYWVRYGTLASFELIKSTKKEKDINIYLREDASISDFVEVFLQANFHKFFNKNNIPWYTREAITDFLMMKSKLKLYTDDFNPTVLPKTLKETAKFKDLYQKSNQFLEEIGIENKEDLEILGPTVFVNGKKTDVMFTRAERKLLRLLLTNRDQTVSYFKIGDELWDDPEKFSLWAISRLIYKIKFKLDKCGFPIEKLKNIRGIGYKLTK